MDSASPYCYWPEDDAAVEEVDEAELATGIDAVAAAPQAQQRQRKGMVGSMLGALGRALSSRTAAAAPTMPAMAAAAAPAGGAAPPAAAAAAAARRARGRAYRHEADTNVLSLALGTLAEGVAVATGDPTFCTMCRASLSVVSRLTDHTGKVVREGGPRTTGGGAATAADAGAADETGATAARRSASAHGEPKAAATATAGAGAGAASAADESKTATGHASAGDESKTPTAAAGGEPRALEEGDLLWNCEFCGTANVVTLDEDELPSAESVDYVLEAAPAASNDPSATSEDDGIIVFAIDTSGSMCVTTEVAGKVQLKGDRTESMRALRTAGDDANQWFPGQRRNVTYVSRLQSVSAAVTAQITALRREHPNKRVALVSFSNEVVITGDGTGDVRHMAGTRLDNFEQLVEAGASFPLDGKVGDTGEALVGKVHALEEGGSTALGPALLVSVCMAGRSRGSKVVLCTDGLANVGLGAVDGDTEEAAAAAQAFYARVGAIAAEKGVVIDVVGIEGEGCDVETLSYAVDPSGGEITKVAPADVTRNFTTMLANKAIATQVSATMFLHAALKFRNTEEEDVLLSGNRVMRALGNVATDSQVTFEYGIMTKAEREAAGLTARFEHLPFQVQIHYTKMDGMKCVRVISQSKPVTGDRHLAERSARPTVLASHAAQQCARMARRGSYVKSRVNMRGYGHIMQRCAETNQRAEDYAVLNNYAAQMRDLDCALDSEMMSEAKVGLAMSEAVSAGDMEDETTRTFRSKARKHRRKKNDGLSKAIFKAKRATSSAMATPAMPPRAAAAAPGAPVAAAAAPRTTRRAPRAARR